MDVGRSNSLPYWSDSAFKRLAKAGVVLLADDGVVAGERFKTAGKMASEQAMTSAA